MLSGDWGTDALNVWIDGCEATLIAWPFTSGYGWSFHALDGSESTFDWPTLDRIQAWRRSSPPHYEFKTFLSAQVDEGETMLNVVVLGILQETMYFGYQGFESFWGGTMSPEDVERIFGHLERRREHILRSSDDPTPVI